MKKIIFLLFMVWSVAYGQSPSGTQREPTAWTPMTASGYKYKFLRSDSGFYNYAKTFMYDTAFFKGRAYANVIPSLSDSGTQVANTEWVKQILAGATIAGTYVVSVEKNATADSFRVTYGDGSIVMVRDSIGANSFVRDTIDFGSQFIVTALSANHVDVRIDTTRSGPKTATQYYVDSVAAAGGGGVNIYNTDGTLTGDRIFNTDGHQMGFYYTNSGANDAAVFWSPSGLTLQGPNTAPAIQLTTDSMIVSVNGHSSSDTTIYKPLATSPSGGTVRMNSWPGGGGGSPAGNYGNIQIIRNALQTTPGSDSLNFNAGLEVKGGIYSDVYVTAGTRLQAPGLFLADNVTANHAGLYDQINDYPISIYDDVTGDFEYANAKFKVNNITGIATHTGTVIAPTIVGGTTTTSPLTLYATTGVAAAGASIFFKGGTNGGTTYGTMSSAGAWDFASGAVTIGGNLNGFNGLFSGAVRTGAASTLSHNGRNIFTATSDGFETLTSSTTTANTAVLSVGALRTAYVAKTANYTATAFDETISCTTNAFTITLPTAVGCAGQKYNITNSGAANTITIATTSSQTFANVTATPTTLSLVGLGAVIVVSDGANWLQLK